jgi:hypothetical protein
MKIEQTSNRIIVESNTNQIIVESNKNQIELCPYLTNVESNALDIRIEKIEWNTNETLIRFDSTVEKVFKLFLIPLHTYPCFVAITYEKSTLRFFLNFLVCINTVIKRPLQSPMKSMLPLESF